MTNRILNSDTYHDEIRDKLGVDNSVLSDPQIDAVTVIKIAEARVIDRVGQFCDFSTLQGDDQTFLYSAAVAMTAAILAPSMAARIMKSEKDSDYQYTNNDVDWTKRASDLEVEAYGYIDYISVQPVVNLSLMGASGPTRANSDLNETPSIVSGDSNLYPTNME